MNQPDKWRETIDPFSLPYTNFILLEVLGYPHAGNDVFYAKGIYEKKEVFVFIKVERQDKANIRNEIETLHQLNVLRTPKVIDYDEHKTFMVSIAIDGERLSTIVGDNLKSESLEYMEEYGELLATFHLLKGDFKPVVDRRFFHIQPKEYFEKLNISFLHDYLTSNLPEKVNTCFCHGDFHYANILWKNHHISGILDFELSGVGNKEFDIAWAIIRRPGQKFLNTEEEVRLFLKGYSKAGTYVYQNVIYYMALIYQYFYQIGKDDQEYQTYVLSWLEENCQ